MNLEQSSSLDRSSRRREKTIPKTRTPEEIFDLWTGDTVLQEEDTILYLLPVSLHTEDEFRAYLARNMIRESCEYAKDHPSHRYTSTLYFLNTLDCMMTVLLDSERKDLRDILMELPLPRDFYSINDYDIVLTWIENSEIDSFQLFLAQGHKVENLKTIIEDFLVESGNVDVLDFLLSLPPSAPEDTNETESEEEDEDLSGFEKYLGVHGKTHEEEEEKDTKTLHNDIVYNACYHENVDMLDRLLAHGYSVNKETTLAACRYSVLPIYAAVNSKSGRTDILYRLIMYGADVNIVGKNQCSPLVYALVNDNILCLERLLDVGARVNNESDWKQIINGTLHSPELMEKLVKAGLDFNFETGRGTILNILKKKVKNAILHGDETSVCLEELQAYLSSM